MLNVKRIVYNWAHNSWKLNEYETKQILRQKIQILMYIILKMGSYIEYT